MYKVKIKAFACMCIVWLGYVLRPICNPQYENFSPFQFGKWRERIEKKRSRCKSVFVPVMQTLVIYLFFCKLSFSLKPRNKQLGLTGAIRLVYHWLNDSSPCIDEPEYAMWWGEGKKRKKRKKRVRGLELKTYPRLPHRLPRAEMARPRG